MPFTPFHLGPASSLGLAFNRFLNLTALVIAGIIIDIEPFAVLFFNLNYPLHGFFHSFLGSSIVAVVMAFLITGFSKSIKQITAFIRIKQNFSKRAIWLASFSGAYLHILLDAPLYTDIKPFYPLGGNPLYGLIGASSIYLLCAILLLSGVFFYLHKIIKK